MTANTALLLILSAIVAIVLAYFQYYYKAKSKSRVHLLLAFLRFFIIFGILLLLINPKIEKNTYEIVKTPLFVLVDNSNSIKELKQNEIALKLYQQIVNNEALQDKFELQSYSFDSEIIPSDSFTFMGSQTNIDKAAKGLNNFYKNNTSPIIILTDGNATTGNDYVYSFNPNNTVYPIILGDTTDYMDLKINQLNVNKYAFYKNKFPVEVFLQYTGNKNLSSVFSITKGNKTVYKENIIFSNTKTTAVITTLLPADKTGLQVYKATITSREKEKNSYNNTKNFAVEVIDQKSEVAIISAINHPDIGALKRAIESNPQRRVTIFKPNETVSLQNYTILILYQPTTIFKNIFEANKKKDLNTWIITGLNTDYNFLNQQQNNFDFRLSQQKEDYTASFNSQFNLFGIENIGFENYPPLQNVFGTIQTKGNVNTLLSSKIRNINTDTPLLVYVENEGKRNAYLFGENSWKWRLQSHIDKNSFENYDLFIDKTIQFLASNSSKKALVVNHESFYNSGEDITITAQYFNKNYEFDKNARLTISLTNKINKQIKNYDLLKGNGVYKVNLDGLTAGEYTFTVKEVTSNTIYNSYFQVLDFNIEKQFVNPDFNKLTQLAVQTKGKLYFTNQVDDLIQKLLEESQYKSLEKKIVKKTPLIDFIPLLILIALSLTAEWFIRKYNGLL